MNIKDFKASLPYLFKAELTGFLWGRAGIGKSNVIKQYADEMGYKFFPFYLGTQSDIGDILGLADFVRDKSGTAVATTFATPKWLKDTIDYCNANPDSGAIIFLDEFNRARRDILQGMFSLALDKTFHTIRLPKNCHVIAAGNPPTDEYVTTDVDETALMARFVHIKLEPTFDEWCEYAKGTEMNSDLLGFVKQQPVCLEGKHSAFELPVKPDRRAWSRLDKLFKLNTPTEILYQLMYGIIGLERTVAFQEYLKSQDKPLSFQQILEGKKDLLKKWSNPDEVSGSFLSISCDNLLAGVKDMDEKKEVLNNKQKKILFDFFFIVPKDIAYKTLKSLIELNSALFKDFYTTKDYQDKLLDLVKDAKGSKAA